MIHELTRVEVASVAVLMGLASTLSLHDVRDRRLPNLLTALFLAFGLAFSLIGSGPDLMAAVAGAACGGLLVLCVRLWYLRTKACEVIGLGDMKLAAGCGAWVGAEGIGALLAGAAALALLTARIRRLAATESLPFGPFLCASTVAMWAWLHMT